MSSIRNAQNILVKFINYSIFQILNKHAMIYMLVKYIRSTEIAPAQYEREGQRMKGKRNMRKYSEEGKKTITGEYDLQVGEAMELMEIAKTGDVLDALCVAYYSGFEAGRRQATRTSKGGVISGK